MSDTPPKDKDLRRVEGGIVFLAGDRHERYSNEVYLQRDQRQDFLIQVVITGSSDQGVQLEGSASGLTYAPLTPIELTQLGPVIRESGFYRFPRVPSRVRVKNMGSGVATVVSEV